MTALDWASPATATRAVRNRVLRLAAPRIYGVRERIPRYSLRAQTKAFCDGARARGLGDVSRYYWYHTVDLGGGLVTPGTHDYRAGVDAFGFSADMSGTTVLDVGSATGFFAFEFERRGANVVSVEVPSLAGVDRFPHLDSPQMQDKLAAIAEGNSAYSRGEFESVFRDDDDTYRCVLDGPFKLCHRALGSKVDRRYATIHDLPETDLGTSGFDLVFLGDLLLHTMHPLAALAAVAPLCQGRLVISQHMPERLGNEAAVQYVGGDDVATDASIWWYPNFACFEALLKKLGFGSVRIVGRNTGFTRPAGRYYDRPVLHAVR